MSLVHTTKETFAKDIESGLVLVDFYADWCGPCQILGPILEELATTTEEFKIVKLNVDEAQEIAGQFSVLSIPTMIAFKDGQKVDQKVGLLQKEDIVTWMKSL